jgi:hypothetical protein
VFFCRRGFKEAPAKKKNVIFQRVELRQEQAADCRRPVGGSAIANLLLFFFFCGQMPRGDYNRPTGH